MVAEGLSDAEARARIYMVDRFGLITENQPNLLNFQKKLAQKAEVIEHWGDVTEVISLLDVVKHAKPTVLIGVSGQPGLFAEEIIRTMAQHCERPIVMPLSNPTSRVEAVPADLVAWTEGKALIATGSPFTPVNHHGKLYNISQCNNSYIFPGIGLGAVACGATHVTENMLMASSRALADCSPLLQNPEADLLPPLSDIQKVSKVIAFQVAKAAMDDGVAVMLSDEALQQKLDEAFWKPAYRSYKRVPF